MIVNETDKYIFSDETGNFRIPSEPNPGDTVKIYLRVLKDTARRVMLLTFSPRFASLMRKQRSDGFFDFYEAEIVCFREIIEYVFVVETEHEIILYNKTGSHVIGNTEEADDSYAFHFTPGFHVPEWAKGAVQYQIFTDRFCNGDPSNDVCNKEYYYVSGHVKHAPSWDAPIGDSDILTFYGGDLEGIRSKLDYLQSIGVEVLYLNPIFISPSTHKYDVQDYEHIDPHFGVITDDFDYEMMDWEKHNGYAQRYIRRITSAFNLYASDLCFSDFCNELHARGMKIILDGVFNHCGSFNKWIDREGIYLDKPGFEKGAYQSADSPYRNYFTFRQKRGERFSDYEGWWGYSTLPKLNYEDSPELCEEIYSIAEKWASPPFSIDGWRLDVAADLGHSEEFNHSFWKEFRRRLKAVNPNLLIIAEHYGDPSSWLRGDEWDTVMNYDAFMEPVSFFLTGMEKHSDSFSPDLFQNGEAFFSSMFANMARMQQPSLLSAMNELSNHDHSRFLTRTNMTSGRLESRGAAGADGGVSKNVFKEAITIQMTWPGAPTVYYGDEAGLTGWTDPDNRRTYPWGKEDADLINLHRTLAGVRKAYPVLKTGSIISLFAGHGIISYARFDCSECLIVCCNNLNHAEEIKIPVIRAGAENTAAFSTAFSTACGNHFETFEGKANNGWLSVSLPPESAIILCTKEMKR